MKKIIPATAKSTDSRPEIIIPIIGASGAGMSTFVNYLVQDEALKSPVGHRLTSCTSELLPIPLSFPNDDLLKHYKIILVDTPGFTDTHVGDAAILQRIADWLGKAYRDKKVLGGVIYLHDIFDERYSGTVWRNLEMLQHMCGEAAFGKVIIGTTKWTRISRQIGKDHEEELKDVYWRLMLAKGACTKRFDDSYDSALSFVKDILRHRLLDVYLRIQTENVDDKKIIPETQAGKELRFTLKEVLAMQRRMAQLEEKKAEGAGDDGVARKYKETEDKVDALIGQIQDSAVPFVKDILRDRLLEGRFKQR
ncbi:hypothetical protein CPC08DRAFT_717070 [Agrocybe pediades]|nr:hypothetical protein CPC08DRAFT_717070 [Agrocybe pediades]